MFTAIEARPPAAFVRHLTTAFDRTGDASRHAFPGGLRFDLVRDAVTSARTARDAASTALDRVAPAGALRSAAEGRSKLSAGLHELIPFARERFSYPHIPDGLDRALHAANSHFRLAGYLFDDAIEATRT